MERKHLDWLLNKSAETARRYLELYERATALPEDSDERSDVEGEMMAWLYQLELDAKDTRKEHDTWLDSLPNDEKFTSASPQT